jgi:hypothetical protein
MNTCIVIFWINSIDKRCVHASQKYCSMKRKTNMSRQNWSLLSLVSLVLLFICSLLSWGRARRNEDSFDLSCLLDMTRITITMLNSAFTQSSLALFPERKERGYVSHVSMLSFKENQGQGLADLTLVIFRFRRWQNMISTTSIIPVIIQ